MIPGSTVKVTNKNIEEIKASISSLLKNKDKLFESINDYPLQIDFCGYRVTVDKNSELEQLIKTLQSKVSLYFQNGN